MQLKLLIQTPYTITWPWTQDISCFHELACLWSTFTNLPSRSSTLKPSPPVVQHTWSIQLQTSSLVAALKCEHKTYEPPRSYPHTRASLIWTSLLILITFSSPVRNLPAHDTVKHLLVQIQHHNYAKRKPEENTTLCAIVWRFLSAARQKCVANRLAIPICRQEIGVCW